MLNGCMTEGFLLPHKVVSTSLSSSWTPASNLKRGVRSDISFHMTNSVEDVEVENNKIVSSKLEEGCNDFQEEASSSTEEDSPHSIRKVIEFAIPAIGVYLCSPLLSTIDTSTVGLFCGTLQQAALNPAVTIIDYSSRTMSFLYTGTTNMMATSQENKEGNGISDTLLGALQFSLLVGIGLGLFILATSQRMLVPLIGNNTIDVEVLHAAWRYVAIRAIGLPAAALIGTSQAACLGLQDNKTPFRTIVITAVLNLVLDVALVGRKWAWIGGTAGAAWATTISQVSVSIRDLQQIVMRGMC